MDKDIQERDAFIERMLERDEKKTKHKDKPSNGLTASQIQELATRGSISSSNKDKKVVDSLRELSRQQYLEKREEKEIKLLEMSMKDEEYLFEGIELTKEEKRRLEVNKNIISMAKDKHRFNYKDDGYKMPDAYEDAETGRINKRKRDGVLTARYEAEEVLKSEQEIWEEDQVHKSLLKFGAKESKQQQQQKEYDYVFEDQIDFISTDIMKNTSKLKHKKDSAQISTEDDSNSKHALTSKTEEEEVVDVSDLTPHEKILLGRRKLPVYSYREEFLQAVRENKVLIVVGETGSGKTTQIPQYLYEDGWSKIGKIGCTQPRRVAAMSVGKHLIMFVI